MIQWLNKFGHCISYDEAAFAETFLANEEIKHQAIKSYLSLSVRPYTFVTFVWDNNDVKPETLTSVHALYQRYRHSIETR